jgi:chromosome segregation ATPase
MKSCAPPSTCCISTLFSKRREKPLGAAASGEQNYSTGSDMADDLATDISKTKERIEELEDCIDTIRRGNDAAVSALGYGSRDEAKADLPALTAEKAQLNERLNTYEKQKLAILTQQQQQSGAGTSMLPVRQEVVMFPCQSSCCMHQQTLQLSERVFVACAFDPA